MKFRVNYTTKYNFAPARKSETLCCDTFDEALQIAREHARQSREAYTFTIIHRNKDSFHFFAENGASFRTNTN